MTDAAAGESMIARIARVLRAFDEDHDSLTLTELAARADLAVPTAHRITRELVSEGLLDRTGARYSIGTGLWEQGELAAVSLRFREIVLPFLLTLYEVTGENVHLAILDGTEALYVARLTGPRSVPTVSRAGGRLPLHTTGVGKALLAFQSEDFLCDFFEQPLDRATLHSVVSEAAIRAELAETRRSGFSTTAQEMTLGNASLAVPIFVADGPPYAAVGLVAHLARSDIRRSAPLLKEVAAGMADALGASLDGGTRKWRDVFH
ncbi:MAG: IclR family transcriptional regulator [Homoserinimonas sp.]|nr:IclR family transcriptional regulator [Homoserinimonas sp.]